VPAVVAAKLGHRGAILFRTESEAQDCIDEFGPELLAAVKRGDL
jgi:hypothetical protein